jgi:hypothetical protein
MLGPEDLDRWLDAPALRVAHRRESHAPEQALWEAARTVRLCDAGRLGRLVRWRIPGLRPDAAFDEVFRRPPFLVLEDRSDALISGLVGRIWTLRRDYPILETPEQFTDWSRPGTVRVLFGNWIEPAGEGRAALASEVRVQPFGLQGRIGLAAVRPLVSAFQGLVASDGIAAAVRRAEGR